MHLNACDTVVVFFGAMYSTRVGREKQLTVFDYHHPVHTLVDVVHICVKYC